MNYAPNQKIYKQLPNAIMKSYIRPLRLSNTTHDSLCAPFTPEDLRDGAFRSPNKSSPGKPHPHWISFLQDQGITSWHDRTATEPLTYLGFAICSSANQRATYALSIISKIRAYCQLHFTRALAYRGRVTVINALLSSKLWHVMRLFTFSSPELKQLQQLAATFINRGSKISRLAFDNLTQLIHQGGLKLLDPATQANALQWR
ncbi:uncharacterized protein ATC70_006096 [Mucor velutinosus]|uniref:Uncharacterized protein n=1 Tax=Mucor velutinosus TaxID=708070 RepID=A0AAN7HYZ6_9FUNG|nr:hypothetical protein ATC70_006096 [Mucor velutinosus]